MNFNKIAFTGAIALIISAGTGFAQVKKKPIPSSKGKPVAAASQIKPASLPIDPEVITGKLANGLTYYIRSNSVPKSRATLLLVTKAGSLLETDAQQGAAHFIEHLAFNGTRDFPKSDLTSYLKARGSSFGADVSASSSFDNSVYQLSLPTDTVDVFERGFKLLANWAGNITFDATEIEKERGGVVEEARAGGKNAQDRIQKQTIPILLKNSRYAQRLPVGKDDVLKTLDQANIKSFYHDWYRPDLQAVIVVGDFDAKHIEQLIKDNFSTLKNPAPEKPVTTYAVTPTPGTTVNFAADKEYPYLEAQIMALHPPTTMKTVADYMQDLRIRLFNQMLDARVTEVVNQRNTQLLGGQAIYGSLIGKQDAFTTIAVTKSGGLESAIKAIVAETERARKFGFTLTELERAKQNTLLAVGNIYQGKNQTLSTNFISPYIQNFVNGEPIPGVDYEYNFYTNNIGKITLAEVNALAAKYTTSPNRVVIIKSSDAEKASLPNESAIQAWIADAGKSVTAYVDETDEPFLPKLPAPGKVVSTVQDSVLSITKLTLSNGIKVILKPTQFTNNQILINGYSFGGTSLASDQDFASVRLADKLIANSGVGDLTPVQINKRLSSRQVTISPYISETTQGISGNTAPADFEAAMQLLYLYFTQPRKDAAAWQEIVNQEKSSINRKSTDPLGAYQDTVAAILNNHNPRGIDPTIDKLNVVSVDKAFDFYKNRFADASGFTFAFVGSFAVDQIISYIETYLGSLPATNKKETYKNLGMYPQAGQITKTVVKGTSDKASVQLTYSGRYDYSEANNLQMDALEEILNIRLESKLTEKDGAFSPGAKINYIKIPEGRYEVTLFFDATPADVDKVTNMVLDEINKLKLNGADPKEIQSFTISEAKLTQSHFRQNIFWAGYLSTTSQNQEDPDRLLQHVQTLDQVTVQSTKDAASKYLSGTNLIKLTLLPEKK